MPSAASFTRCRRLWSLVLMGHPWSFIAMSPFAEEPPPITLGDGQTPSSIVIIGPSNWLLTLRLRDGLP
jgi:hypothetical protein